MSNKTNPQLEKFMRACKSLITVSLLKNILILVIFILLVFSLNFSRPPAVVHGQSEPTCTDSDGGINYEVASYVEAIGPNGWPTTKYDVCEIGDREGQVREYYCNGATPWPRFYQCPNGCAEGACLTEPGTCTDADGDGYAIEGGTCGLVDCNDTSPAVNPGAAELCQNGIDDDCDGAIDANDLDCASGPTCTDSDGGLNYEIAGYVETVGPNGWGVTKYDVCETGDREGQVREFYCNGNLPWPNFYQCPSGCAAGACVTEPGNCTDADGDGYAVEGGICGLVDCNDSNPAINPGATEVCENAVDDDCDGLVNEGCTPPPGNYTDCTDSQIGTILYTHPSNGISTGPILVEVNNWSGFNWPGMVGAQIKTDADIYFPQLSNWLRTLNESNISRLELKVNNWAVDYECIGYGSILGSTGSDPADYDGLKFYINEAYKIAEEHGKCLVLAYDPGHLEKVTTDKFGSMDPGMLQDLVNFMASRSDVWVIKIAEKIQKQYGPDDQFRAVIEEWVNRVKIGNPKAKIWIQMAMQEFGESEPSAETVLAYREKVVDLVDGVSPLVIYSGESQLQTAVNELENTFWYACMQQAPPTLGEETPQSVFPVESQLSYLR